MEAVTTPDGETRYVARDETEPGSEAPFFVVYLGENRERRWGFFCGNCESVDNAMDTMGRIRCNACPNVRKPTEWDAAHE